MVDRKGLGWWSVGLSVSQLDTHSFHAPNDCMCAFACNPQPRLADTFFRQPRNFNVPKFWLILHAAACRLSLLMLLGYVPLPSLES